MVPGVPMERGREITERAWLPIPGVRWCLQIIMHFCNHFLCEYLIVMLCVLCMFMYICVVHVVCVVCVVLCVVCVL